MCGFIFKMQHFLHISPAAFMCSSRIIITSEDEHKKRMTCYGYAKDTLIYWEFYLLLESIPSKTDSSHFNSRHKASRHHVHHHNGSMETGTKRREEKKKTKHFIL